jgi:hypothetical protein
MEKNQRAHTRDVHVSMEKTKNWGIYICTVVGFTRANDKHDRSTHITRYSDLRLHVLYVQYAYVQRTKEDLCM